MNKFSPRLRLILGLAALCPAATFFLPFWEIHLWAPQYPEGLNMKFWLNGITGDYAIINGINHYIGMKQIKAELFPEFIVMPWLVGLLIAAGLAAAATGWRVLLRVYAAMLCAGACAGLLDYYRWGYDYGHDLDPRAAINVPGMSYQPPLIGYKNLLNFVAYSGPETGGWIFIAVGVIAVGLVAWDWWSTRRAPAPAK